jgi:hypothetical protein
MDRATPSECGHLPVARETTMPRVLAGSLPAHVDARQNRSRRAAPAAWSRLRAALRSFAAVVGRRGSYKVPSPYPINTVLSENSQFESLGLHPSEARAFQKLAERHRYEIFVRIGHFTRVPNVGRPGLRPKPAGVYQKTNKAAFVPGLVVYKDSELAKARQDLAMIGNPDPERASRALQALATEGLDLCPLGQHTQGLRDGAGNFFYGDIDIHGVYRRVAPGRVERVDANTFVRLFNADLTATGLHAPNLLEYGTPMVEKDFGVLPHSPVQHGAHDEWTERNDASYAGGINMGPLPGVIHFRPGAKPHYISTVPHYRDILSSLGQEHAYTSAAWSNGRNRLAAVRYVRCRSTPPADEPASTRL